MISLSYDLFINGEKKTNKYIILRKIYEFHFNYSTKINEIEDKLAKLLLIKYIYFSLYPILL